MWSWLYTSTLWSENQEKSYFIELNRQTKGSLIIEQLRTSSLTFTFDYKTLKSAFRSNNFKFICLLIIRQRCDMIIKYDNPSITMNLLDYSTMTFDHVTWKITIGIIHTVQSMVTIKQLGEKELQLKHSFFKMTEGPTDMWKKGNMTTLFQKVVHQTFLTPDHLYSKVSVSGIAILPVHIIQHYVI